MSLILEALRKSEAERRRGQVPDLHAVPAAGAPVARDGPPAWLWLALALAAAMVLALALWLARSLLTAPPRPIEPAAAAVDDFASAPATPRAEVPLRRAADAAVAVGVLAQAPGSLAADPDPASAPASAPEHSPAPQRPGNAMVPASVPPPRPEPERSAPASAAVAVAALPASAPPTREPTAAAPSPTSTAARSAPADAAPATPTGSALLRLADLDTEQRRQLPPLKMSMHLWAPTQRFAIIDGARVAEGDRIGDAVVEEITASGVVLAWQGRRLQIPIR